MLLFQAVQLFMAAKAECGVRLLDQAIVISRMRIMTAVALPFGKGGVFAGEGNFQFLMAGGATLSETRAQQVGIL